AQGRALPPRARARRLRFHRSPVRRRVRSHQVAGFVVGVKREADRLGISVEQYFAKWKDGIRNSVLSEGLRGAWLSKMDFNSFLWIWGHCHNDSIAIRRFLRWRGIVLAGRRFYGSGNRTKADRGHCGSFLGAHP